MARKGLTAVKQEKLVAVAQKLGLNVVANKGWTKCYLPGLTKGKALGIPNTKSVTRVELVGFEHERAVAHPKPPAATVTQMLDFSKDEKYILNDFFKVGKALIASIEKPAEVPAEAPAAEPTEAPAEQPAAEVAAG